MFPYLYSILKVTTSIIYKFLIDTFKIIVNKIENLNFHCFPEN